MILRNPEYNEIPLLAQMRYEFANSIRQVGNKDEFIAASQQYFYDHFSDNSLIVLLGEENGKIVSAAMLCIYQTLPRPSLLSGRDGLLLNVYTHPDYRRRGYASQLLTELFSQAKKAGVRKIHLDYTDEGYPLYCKLGFYKLDREMAKDL